MAVPGIESILKEFAKFNLRAGRRPCIEVKVMYVKPTIAVKFCNCRFNQILQIVLLSGIGTILQHSPHRGVTVDVGVISFQVAIFCLKNGNTIKNSFYLFSKLFIHRKPSLNIILIAMQTVFSVETIRIPGFQFIHIHLHDGFKVIPNSVCTYSEIPSHISKLFSHMCSVQLMPLKQMLFQNINCFAGFSVQSH